MGCNGGLGMIKGCRRHLFVFRTNRAIPPTKGTEQARRPCVIFRKVSHKLLPQNCVPMSGPLSKLLIEKLSTLSQRFV